MRTSDDSRTTRAAYRAGRLFRSNNGWFVDTREGQRGPFPTRELATCDAKNYAQRMAEAHPLH